jgi:hypothetical protein
MSTTNGCNAYIWTACDAAVLVDVDWKANGESKFARLGRNAELSVEPLASRIVQEANDSMGEDAKNSYGHAMFWESTNGREIDRTRSGDILLIPLSDNIGLQIEPSQEHVMLEAGTVLPLAATKWEKSKLCMIKPMGGKPGFWIELRRTGGLQGKACNNMESCDKQPCWFEHRSVGKKR